MHSPRRAPQAAFTLVELSVVLAVIGLLIGGVMAGQTMIKRAEIASIATDFVKFKTAVQQFKMQFGTLPGDYADATANWGTDADGCPTHTNRVPKKETCNGNGSAFIDWGAESFRAWQHLANAGLVEGTFSGVAGAGGANHAVIAGTAKNAVTGRRAGTGYSIASQGPLTSDTNFYDMGVNAVLFYGLALNNNYPFGGALTPRETKNFDLKFDDGKPAYGQVRVMKPAGAANCAASAAQTSDYQLLNKGTTCSIIYLMD